MSLTGQLFAWFTILMTLGAFGTLVWRWSWMAGPGPVKVTSRAGALLGVNLLVLLTAAVQLNNQFLFFAGWADVRGAMFSTSASSQLSGGGTPRSAAEATVTGSGADTGPVQTLLPLPAGSRVQDGVTSYTVTGPRSHITGQILLTLPPGYSTRPPQHRYPVIETFSGYPSSPSQWIKTMRLQTFLANEVATHRLSEVIVVSPQVEIPAGADTECVNGRAGNPQLETWLAQDVPDWVASHFLVRPDRGSWVTMGLSTGGWCAAMVAMLHPARFGGAVVLGGYFRPLFEPEYEPYPTVGPLTARYDLVTLAKRSPPPLALWIETSHADPVSYSSSTALLKAAHPPLSVTATVLQDAGHRIGVWRDLVPNALTWLGATMPGFKP